MARLHSRIYLHFLGVLVVAGLAGSLVFAVGARGTFGREVAERMVRHVASLAGERFGDRAALAERLRQLHADLDIDLVVRGLDGRVVAAAGRALPPLSDRQAADRARGRCRRRLASHVARGGPGPRPAHGDHRRDAGSGDPAPVRRPSSLVARAGGDRHLARGGGRDATPGAPHLAPARAPHRGRAPPRPRRPRRARSRSSCALAAVVDAALFTRRR